MRFSLLVFFTLIFICCTNLSAQTGKDTDLWVFTKKADHHQSIVEIDVKDGSASGVLFKVNGNFGYILTAWHVIENEMDPETSSIEVGYHKNSKVRRTKSCKVLSFHEDNDIAILEALVPKDMQPARLAETYGRRREQFELAGFGGDSLVARTFEGAGGIACSAKAFVSDAALLPSDSGGPVFNDQGEIISIISGSWFKWWAEAENKEQASIEASWPAKGAGLDAIKSLIADTFK